MQKVKLDPERPDMALVRRAAELIASGGVIAYPTDTVYGLGADPHNLEAVQRVFEMKGREASKGLTLILADVAQLEGLVSYVPNAAKKLMAVFWPGPLTIVLPLAPGLDLPALRGNDTVAVRVPASVLCRALVQWSRTPLTATSANFSGHPEPTTAEQVAATLGPYLDLIIDGGPSPLRVPSTLVDATVEPAVVLRPGAIPTEMIHTALREERP
ncbi:MAG: L-threonylcarbamoyladenylate synthase [Candidatus Oleimicrobiaceae bacterium]